MRKIVIYWIFFFSASFGLVASDRRSEMISTLDVIKYYFKVNCGSIEWTKQHSDWDLEREVEIIKAKILSSEDVSLKTYQRWLRDLFNSTRDYHADIKFFSTEAADLPFRVKSVEGAYLVTWRNPFASTTSFPVEIGDELILFDGRPVDDVIQQIKMEE